MILCEVLCDFEFFCMIIPLNNIKYYLFRNEWWEWTNEKSSH